MFDEYMQGGKKGRLNSANVVLRQASYLFPKRVMRLMPAFTLVSESFPHFLEYSSLVYIFEDKYVLKSPIMLSAPFFIFPIQARFAVLHTGSLFSFKFESTNNMKLVLCLFAVLTSAIAAPMSPDETSKTFKLKSLVLTPPNPSFNNLYLEPYHIYPGANYAVLSPESATNPGIVGYLNGTAADFANESTDLLFNSNPAPSGFIIDSVNVTYNPVLINAGNGTLGIFIEQGLIKYNNPISGGFYACNNTLAFGPAVQLFYKPKIINTPTGCSDVELTVEYVS